MTSRFLLATLALCSALFVANATGQENVIRVDLAYRKPSDGPGPNFSPKGTQVPLAVWSGALPADAVWPAKVGTIKVGPNQQSWIPVLATAIAGHPKDLCQLFLDRNRNGSFADDGPALTAEPKQNEKTKAWWSSVNQVELLVPYGPDNGTQPYLVNFWIVRDDNADAPDVLRYSVGSWRYGTATIGGVDALVAAMDSDNNAIFDKNDMWSVLQASAPNAARAVLSIDEARSTSRLMFLQGGPSELVLEFRGFSPDGRRVDMAVVDRPVTKAADRKADDMLAEERDRPRTRAPFEWGRDLDAALARAKISGRKVFVDFETTWCGPCKTMDEWIYTDAEVAAVLNTGFAGVKLDGDIEKALVKRFKIAGYPTMIVLDASGAESWRTVGYQSSKELLALLNAKR